MAYTLTNRLDRAIQSVSLDLTHWTDGRSVPWGTSAATDWIAGGVEPGEHHEREVDVQVHGWDEKPKPLVWELRIEDVRDAEGRSFFHDFGREICAG